MFLWLARQCCASCMTGLFAARIRLSEIFVSVVLPLMVMLYHALHLVQVLSSVWAER